MLLSGSRDKTLIVWNLTRDEAQYGVPKRSLHGHSHIVSDCVRSMTMKFPRSQNSYDLFRSSPLTAPMPYPRHGTRPFAFGNCPRVLRHAASLATPMMFSPSPSRPTTARLSQAPATARSSCGTHLVTANIPLPKRVIPSGYPVFGSVQTLKTPSSFQPAGIRLLR